MFSESTNQNNNINNRIKWINEVDRYGSEADTRGAICEIGERLTKRHFNNDDQGTSKDAVEAG